MTNKRTRGGRKVQAVNTEPDVITPSDEAIAKTKKSDKHQSSTPAASVKTTDQQPAAKRYRLRSGAARNAAAISNPDDDADGNDKENSGLELSAANKKQPPKTKTKSGPKPFIEYKGAVEYYTEAADIEAACAKLLKWVQTEAKREDVETIPIAFDMEWPFSFQTGPGRSAVIQMCADVGLCYVLHISKLDKLPESLLELLYHEKVCLHGVCIKNDLRKLQRDFPVVDSQRMIDQCVDLGVWCNTVCNTGGRWSMERLVMYLCKLQINKEGKVRRSKWDVQPLTAEQQIYAAIDVYISQVMYLELDQRARKKAQDEELVVAEFGEKALAAIKQLQ